MRVISRCCGTAARAQNDFDNAYSRYSKACQLNPELGVALFGLAQMYIHRGTRGCAMACARVVSARANCARPWAGVFAAACTALETAQRLFPESVDVMKLLGMVYVQLDRRGEAEKLLARVVQADTTDGDSWLAYASVLEASDLRAAHQGALTRTRARRRRAADRVGAVRQRTRTHSST